MAVGEEADMADAMKPVRHGMQQEPPDELVGVERHDLGLAVVAVVLPGEADLAARKPSQSAVRHGDTVGVAAEIGQYLLGSGERALAPSWRGSAATSRSA